MLLTSSIEKTTSESDLSVIRLKGEGKVLPLRINERCFAKKGLKVSIFSLKSAIKLP